MDNSIIVLANSHKTGGRCIIRKTLNGKWIRPINNDDFTNNPTGALDENKVKNINVLDIVTIPDLNQLQNQDHQTENYSFSSYESWHIDYSKYERKSNSISFINNYNFFRRFL